VTEQHPQKLDYKKTFLIGFGLFGLNIMWKLYNDYIPIFLQAGNPTFKTLTQTAGFGLGATLAGFVMTLDNLAGLFLLPLIGVWSDRIWTPLGRRKPFIVTLAPISVLAFMAIPFIARGIPAALNGQTAELSGSLIVFMRIIAVFIVTMAGFRTPVIALMPDLTPSPLRSQANGIINLMGGIGGIVITFVGAWLYGIDIAAPFIAGGVLMGLAALLLVLLIKEPRTLETQTTSNEASEEGLGAFKGIRHVSPAARKSLYLLMSAIFLWFVGYNAIETFFTSYGVNVLNIKENQASLLSSVSYITFIIFAVPSGFIAAKFGRKRTITIGLLTFAALTFLGFLVPNIVVVGIALSFGGIAWSLVNINSLPMVIDTADSDVNIGTFTGLYYIASQLAAIAGPVLNGFVIEQFQNYNLVMLIPAIFFFLAALAMQGVTRGEARKVQL